MSRSAAAYRFDEKKDAESSSPPGSYKSTPRSRSSVLERAREYNRKLGGSADSSESSGAGRPEQQHQQRGQPPGPPVQRSRSLDRGGSSPAASSSYSSSNSRKSRTAARNNGVPSTRQRAMDTVRRDTARSLVGSGKMEAALRPSSRDNNSNYHRDRQPPQQQQPPTQYGARTPTVHNNASGNRLRQQQQQYQDDYEQQQQREEQEEEVADHNHNGAVGVTPELLVDALSGHEDGLLNVAEKLMAHYDQGYDVMGEALIDAFADVQKLFQHVVEAAHMEGAAFEASRSRQSVDYASHPNQKNQNGTAMAGGPAPRQGEYIDQDVKDLLSDALALRTKSVMERCDVLERACIDACALMPVDSESRNRLQLSLSRAETMEPDRAITILSYAMEETIRTESTGTKAPEDGKRAEVVLQHPGTDDLPTLTAELRDILQAPLYRDTPLHSLAERFWKSLTESQKSQQKHAEMLEENLAKLKAEFLLARAEWEEKLNQAHDNTRRLQTKVTHLHQQHQQQRTNNSRHQHDDDTDTMYGSVKSAASKAETVASGVSGLARSLVQNQFNCTGQVPDDDVIIEDDISHLDIRYERPRSRSRSKSSRSFREYSRSPHRMDV